MTDSRPLTIVFSSVHDALDINAFSTTIFYMAEALKAEVPDLEIVRFPHLLMRSKLVQRALRRMPALNPDNNDIYLRLCAWAFARRFKGRRVVVINVVDSPLARFLNRRLPLVHVSDATFALLDGTYYGVYGYMSPREKAFNHRSDAAAIHSLHACFSGEWARQSAIRDYGADPARMSVVSWGCNLPDVPRDQTRLAADEAICRLLFVAGQWKRKGGDIVLETARLLKERGIPVAVDLVGVKPEDPFPAGVDVTYHGRLGKEDPAELAEMLALYRAASFFVLPTKQDCTPMVFAEANMFGTPAVTCDTGGVASVVRDRENGIVLPNTSGAADYADAIEKLWRDRARYQALRESARATYEARLNWNAWARAMVGIVRGLEAQGKI
jgi:glycosyltransferase involved in cell wall biosynthesis